VVNAQAPNGENNVAATAIVSNLPGEVSKPPEPASSRPATPEQTTSALVIRKVNPVYPSLAKSSRQHGTVSVEVRISESGDVISARAVSGPALLKQAAVIAAREWKFKPSTQGGRPIQSIRVITFNFKL
jgi:protein TonB